MRIFFEWWRGRIQHIFIGKKRNEPFIQGILTANCVFWWKFWFAVAAIFYFLLKMPWPIIGRRIIIKGEENIRDLPAENCLCLPNHGSLLGPPLISFAWMLPGGMGSLVKVLKNPEKYFVWQTPNREVTKDMFMAVGGMAPQIVIHSDESGMPKDHVGLLALCRRLQTNRVVTFIEGTRSGHAREPKTKTKSGIEIGYPFRGVGLAIYYSRPLAIPVLIRGEEDIFPIGASIRSAVKNLLFSQKRLEVIFGSPMDISWVPVNNRKATSAENKEIARIISEKVVQEIAALDN